jgi:MFS family permease
MPKLHRRITERARIDHPPLKGEGKDRPLAAEGSPGWGDSGATHTKLHLLHLYHPLPARWRGPTSPLQGEVILFFRMNSMNDVSMSPQMVVTPGAAAAPQSEAVKRRAIVFLNLAHGIDHFVLLIFPAVVISLELVYRRPYAELIALSTAAFVAFGVFSLPAGWLADRWSRRNMMAAFYFGCGVSLAAAGLAPTPFMLAAAMCALGMFAAIYHPVGMAMLIDVSKARPRTLAFNGVCGNLGVTFAAGISTTLAAWIDWRAAFLLPAAVCVLTGIAYLTLVPDDQHRTAKRGTAASVVLSARAAAIMFGCYVAISLAGGLTFNTALIALPKLIDERLGDGVPLVVVGWLATGIFLCGALAQLLMGRLIERTPPHLLFAAVATVQFAAVVSAGYASGLALIVALAVAIGAIYAQVTVGDIVIARYTADAWRGRVYSVRYFLTFITSGIAVQLIAQLYSRGGFDLVLGAIAMTGFVMMVGVYAMAAAVNGAEMAHRAMRVPAV